MLKSTLSQLVLKYSDSHATEEINSQNLIHDLGYNSLSFANLIVDIEKVFEIRVKDKYFKFDEIDTVEKLSEMIVECGGYINE